MKGGEEKGEMKGRMETGVRITDDSEKGKYRKMCSSRKTAAV